MSTYESVQNTNAVADMVLVRPGGGIAGFFNDLVRRVACLAARAKERWRARRAYDAFSRMDMHTLADIGANRADMFVAAYGEDHGCPQAANCNEPSGPRAVENKGVA